MKKILLIIIFLLTCCTLAVSTAEISSESRVKAAYLYNFVKFIKWPENTFKSNASPIIIGVFGKNDLSEQLAPLNSRKVRNRPIEIQYYESLEEAHDCQLLYIDIEESDQLSPVLDELKQCHGEINASIAGFFGLQHLFGSTATLIREIVRHGISSSDVYLLGKPYSTNPRVAEALQNDLGYFVHPDSVDQPHHIENDQLMDDRIAEILDLIRAKALNGRYHQALPILVNRPYKQGVIA